MKITMDRGKIINANYGIINYLWKNWEIYDQLLNSQFHIQRTSPKSWIGKRYNVKAKLELINFEEKSGMGTFNYIFTFSVYGIPVSVSAELIYTYAKHNRTAVQGFFEISSKGFMGLLMKFYTKKFHIIADEVINGGKFSCEYLQNNFNEAICKLSEEDRINIKKKHSEGVFCQTPENHETDSNYSGSDYMEMMQRRVGDLEKRLNRELTEIKKSFEIFSIDPALALAGIRKIVEAFARKLLVEHTKLSPGTQSLGSIIDLINKEVEQVPSSIIKSMRVVCEYGNLGIHINSENKSHSVIGKEEFEISLNAALKVVGWYFSNYD